MFFRGCQIVEDRCFFLVLWLFNESCIMTSTLYLCTFVYNDMDLPNVLSFALPSFAL